MTASTLLLTIQDSFLMRRILSFHPRNTLALVHGVECEHIGAVQFPNKPGVQEEHLLLGDDDVLQVDLPPPPSVMACTTRGPSCSANGPSPPCTSAPRNWRGERRRRRVSSKNVSAPCCSFLDLFKLNLHDAWDTRVYLAVHPALLQGHLLCHVP